MRNGRNRYTQGASRRRSMIGGRAALWAALAAMAVPGAALACHGLPVGSPPPTAGGSTPGTTTTKVTNGLIAFDSAHQAGTTSVFRVDPNASDLVASLTNLVAGSTSVSADPAWSPDGKKLAFVSTRDNNPYEQIYVMDADGSNVSKLTSSAQNNTGTLAWSPDGTEIAFTKEDQPNVGDIWVVNLQNGTERRITSNAADDRNPSWSSDGNYIAFQSNRGGKYDIYRVDAHPSTEGSEQGLADLTPGTDGSNEISPDFSADGSSILFQSDRDNPGGDIYLQPTSGTGTITRLTSAQGSAPRFSPDGQKFVFASTRGSAGAAEIYTQPLAPDTRSTKATLVTSSGPNDHPDWQPVITTVTTPSVSTPSVPTDTTPDPEWFRGKPGCGPKKTGGFNASGYHMGPPGNGPGRTHCPV